MSEPEVVAACARQIAAAIGNRDIASLESLLAPGFVHRTPGGGTIDRDAFLQAIANIPGEILSIALDSLTVDVVDDAALVTGIQHARVRVDGNVVDDRKAFIDWFVKQNGVWRIHVAVEPATPNP